MVDDDDWLPAICQSFQNIWYIEWWWFEPWIMVTHGDLINHPAMLICRHCQLLHCTTSHYIASQIHCTTLHCTKHYTTLCIYTHILCETLHYITPLHYTIIYITPLHYTTFYILHYISSYYITFHNNTSLEFIRYFCSHEPRSYGEHPSSSPEACDTSPGNTAPGYLHRPFDQDSVSNAKVLQGSKLPPLGITKYPALVWPYGACSCFGTNPYISLCVYIYTYISI